MLLESIKLENFRQFRNESIDFAQGQDGKNVTIIIGENGTGKTTFAQAFFWCMYGESKTIRLPHQIFHAILTLPCPT